MMKSLVTVLLLNAVLTAMGVTMKEYPVHGWDTWKRAENVGDFTRIEPCAEYPSGAMNILPVADTGQKYELTAYGRIPAEADDCIIVHFTVVASPKANPGATLMFLFEAKDAADDWLRVFREPVQKTVSLLPGTEQRVTLTADLKRYDAEKIGYLCPEVVVTDLASGVVTILPIRVERKKSDYVAPAKPQGPGLAGYVIQPDALRHFTWPAPVGEEKFERLLNFAALGLNIVELTPENRSAAWQWPDGDTITAVHSRDGWRISAGETPQEMKDVLSISGDRLTAAAYGSGVVFRGVDGQNHLVEGGVEATGMTLLHAAGAPDLQVRQLYIADDACSLCWLEEAERELARAKKRYEDNYAYIQPIWGVYDCTRYWENAFQTFGEALAAMRRQAEERTEGFGATLIANPILRDRYSQLVWMASREFIEETGYFGGVFRKTWFTHLGGAGPIAQTLEFARDCDQLVARARRLAKANYREGRDAVAFAAGWTNGLEHVYSAAGDNCALETECVLDAARGEAEDAQLVLTGGAETLDGLVVHITPASPEAPQVALYRTEYVAITASPMPKLPLCRPGDSRMPDVLIPVAPGEPLRLERDANLALQLRVRVPREARPGVYDYTVAVRAGGAAAELPLRVRVHGFALPERPLENIGGLRPGTLREWYGDAAQTARRNLAREMMDCHLEPLDLYSQTPLAEDLDWAAENGVRAWNFGGSLNALADPEPTMLEFLQLYGSVDGKAFRPVPAEFALVPRDPNDSLGDVDVVVTPKTSVAKYRYLKIHDGEVRGWHNRSNYHFFYIYGNNPEMGAVAEVRRPDGTTQEIASARFLQPDQSPATTGLDEFMEGRGMALDNLRDASNRGSVLLEKEVGGEVASLRLFNRIKQGNMMGMSKFYQLFQEKMPPDAAIYLYGFDEVGEHLNAQLVSALKNTREAFPAIRTISTVAHPEATPEIYELLDIHCPANAYATPRADRRRHLKYGIDYWTYIGGGGYYPFGNFERVDQPLVNSRAFLWEPIAFDHIKGFLFWDIHMWRSNNQWIGARQIDWSRWCTTHGHTNGMGALFYPGPDAAIYPSRRAHAIGDGIEDCAAYRLAAELIATKGNPEALAKRLAAIREGFATGMSVFNHDPEAVRRNRLMLYELLDELQ